MRDRDVRIAVRQRLDTLHAGDTDTRVVEEMGIWAGSVRIDIAVINGEMHGFELKSERDNLDRLPAQASLYSEVFDRVTLVVASNHIQKARALVPDWWGLSKAVFHQKEGVRLVDVRRPKINPSHQPLQIARLLWRSEAIHILERYNFIKGFKSKSAEALAQRLATELKLSTLRDEVRAALKARPERLGQDRSHMVEMSVSTHFNPGSAAARTAHAASSGDHTDLVIAPTCCGQ